MAITVKLKDGTVIPVDKALLTKLLSTGNVVDVQGQEEPGSSSEDTPSSSSTDSKDYSSGVRQKAPTVAEAVAPAREPLAKSLSFYESLPDIVGAVDVKKEFPYVGVHEDKADALDSLMEARYHSIMNKPTVAEDILTDPVTYVPGVGQYAKAPRVVRYFIDPALQAGFEYAEKPELTASGTGLLALGGGALGATASKVGEKLGTLGKKAFSKRYAISPQGAEVLAKDVPDIGSTRSSVEKALGKPDDIEGFFSREGTQMTERQSQDLYKGMAKDAKEQISSFRKGHPYARSITGGKIPSIKEVRRWESKIDDFEKDALGLLSANGGDPLTEAQISMLLKEYSDVPPLANILRVKYVSDPFVAPAREAYLATKPAARDYSIGGLVAGGAGKVTSPENLTREGRIAEWLSGHTGFPISGASTYLKKYD